MIRSVYVTISITIVFAIVLILKDFLAFPEFYQDEHHYFPTALLFSKEVVPSLELLRTHYNQLNTPIPFIMGGWVMQVFGEDIKHLRMMNFLVGFGLLLIFIWYKAGEGDKRWWGLIMIMLMPSFYLCAIHYYTDMLAWLFVLLGVVAYLKRRHFTALAAFAAAIASRQYMLAFPLAIGLFEFLRVTGSTGWSLGLLSAKIFADRVWLFYVGAVLTLVPWIWLWGGLAPSAIMSLQHYGEAPLYNPGFVVYMSACAAFYYVLPETLLQKKWSYFLSYPAKYPVTFAGIMVLVATMLFFFSPQQTYNEYFTWPYLGYLDQLLEAARITGPGKNMIFGLLMILTLMRFVTPGRLTLSALLVLTNILLLGKAQLSWDKYFFPTLMILCFFAMHHQEQTIFFKRRNQRSGVS